MLALSLVLFRNNPLNQRTMGFLSENVIPGNHGKIFATNARENHELESVKKAILSVDGIKDCFIHAEIFPVEITVHTSKVVKIEDIENKVKATGFHAIGKGIFEL